jgi:hypothetical protein
VLARPRRPRPAGAAGPYRVSVSCMQCLECEWDPVNVAFFVHLLLIKATLSHRAHRGTYRSRSMSHGPCVSLLLLSSIVLSYFYSTAGRDSSKRLAPSTARLAARRVPHAATAPGLSAMAHALRAHTGVHTRNRLVRLAPLLRASSLRLSADPCADRPRAPPALTPQARERSRRCMSDPPPLRT